MYAWNSSSPLLPGNPLPVHSSIPSSCAEFTFQLWLMQKVLREAGSAVWERWIWEVPSQCSEVLLFQEEYGRGLEFPDYEKTLFFSSTEPRDDCDCFQHLQVWMVTFHSLNVPSGFHLDGSPLLNAHNPVGCSFIDWLCPLLLILAGTERKPLYAEAVSNTISSLEIASTDHYSVTWLNP